MPEIIEENRAPKFSERLLSGLSRAATEGATEIPKFFGQQILEKEKKAQQLRENEAISRLIGQDISGITDTGIKKEILKKWTSITSKICTKNSSTSNWTSNSSTNEKAWRRWKTWENSY